MPFKHVWKFKQPDGSDWEEIWYNASNGTLASQLPENPQVITARQFLLNTINTFVQSTISDLANPRAVLSQVIGLPGLNAPGTPNIAAASTGACNVVKVVGQAGGQKHWWLRGGDARDFEKSIVTGGDRVSQGFSDVLASFLQKAADVQFGLLLGSKVGNPGTDQGYFYAKLIQPGDPLTSTAITLTAAPAAWQVGQRIRIGLTNKKEAPGLAGDWTIQKVAGAVITIAYQCPAGSAIPNPKGRIRLLPAGTVSVISAANSKWVYNGTHRTKSAAGNSRGARRAARLRTSV